MPRATENVIVRPGKRPGKRLSHSKVFGPKFLKGKKNGFADLNLTPMVDMFTMLVIFLIQQFAASGEILYMSKDIKLPEAAHAAQIEPVPVVQISSEVIALLGERVAELDEIEREEYANIPALEEKLRDQKKRFEILHQGDPNAFKGDVNIQADRKIPFKIIKKVMFSCASAGYGNINFAVSQGAAPTAEAPKPVEGA